MKKEANIQRMAEKQKEAKLAVCASFIYLAVVSGVCFLATSPALHAVLGATYCYRYCNIT